MIIVNDKQYKKLLKDPVYVKFDIRGKVGEYWIDGVYKGHLVSIIQVDDYPPDMTVFTPIKDK